MTHSHLKTVSIANEVVFLGAIVVPKNLFVQIAEQVERLDIDVCSLESTLEQAPEVFESVGMNLSVNVGLSMVDNLVLESLVPQSLIGHQRIGVDRAASFNVSANLGLQVMFAASRNDVGANLAATLQNAHDSRLAFDSPVSNLLASLIGVHETSSATDKGFVYFHFFTATTEPHGVPLMQGKANAVHHKPCRLLGDSQSAAHFVGTNAVLGVHDEPNGNHPLVHSERGILEDGSHL